MGPAVTEVELVNKLVACTQATQSGAASVYKLIIWLISPIRAADPSPICHSELM